MSTLIRAAAAMALATLPLVSSPAGAAPAAPAASADAYGVLVDLRLSPTNTPLKLGPTSRAAQDYPPLALAPAEAQVLESGPLPADGSILNHVGVISAIAGANGVPQAVASAQANDVSLLKQANGTPMVSADVVRAQANSDCINLPNATGTTFVNLKILGTPIEQTPAPNTVVDLIVAKVILNEQRPAFDGRGIVVNAIHVISTTTGDALFSGDIVVSHAMSTVNCTNGAGTTGGTNPIKFTKTPSPDTASPGQTVTYTATVTNTAAQPCIVNSFIDHLPKAFDFVSTAGDFGVALDTPPVARTGGGVDLILGNGKTIAVGQTFTQTFVVKVRDDAVPGVYYNNLEIFCANLGNFVKGLDGPVRVRDIVPPDEPEPPVSPPRPAPPKPKPVGPLPRTGGPGDVVALTGLALLGAAFALRRLRTD